jgi:hypothetical protein
VLIANAPPDFDLGPLPERVTIVSRLAGEPFDLMVQFCDEAAHLRRRFDTLARRLRPAGGLWVAWPKKASGVATDLTENVVRDIGLAGGLVDTKVCAIDATWSGLRFVVRLADRPRP